LNPYVLEGNEGLTMELNRLKAEELPQCNRALSLAHSGLLAAAGGALGNGLRWGEDCEKALAQVRSKQRTASKHLRKARRLARSDKAADARAEYALALLANADLAAAKAELEESIDEESELDGAESWLAGIPGTVEGWLDWLLPLVLLGLVALVLAWMAVRETAAKSSRLRGGFEWLGKRPFLSSFTKAATPQVTVEDFDGDESTAEGKDFSTLLTAELPKQAGREPAFPFDRVTKGSEEDGVAADLTKVLAAAPATTLFGNLVQFLSRLFRRRSVQISGHLLPVSDRGAGVTIVLRGAGMTARSSITLWEDGYDPRPGGSGAERWLRLVPAATVWVRWQLASAHGPHGWKPESDGWRSDAQFRSGVAWQSLQKWSRAETLYAEALDSDPTLLPAAHNLALMEVRAERYGPAEERVRKLLAELERRRSDPKVKVNPAERWPTLDTASLYTLTLALAYPTTTVPGKAVLATGADPPLVALATARSLVRTLSCQLRHREKSDLDEPTLRELERAESPSIVVLAGLTIRCEPTTRAAALAGIGANPARPKVVRADLCERLEKLDPWELIEGYALRLPNPSRRTYYNLACYYTTLAGMASGKKGECEDRALAALGNALQSSALRPWAEKDPSLAALRVARKTEFDAILSQYTIEPHGAPATPPSKPDKGWPAKAWAKLVAIFT
jgi:Tfp pilus assembly protein PilF